MKNIKNILFVCTGNSCRSVMAEGLLKKIFSDKKRADIKVSSCGIATVSGFSPTGNTIQVMKKEGIDVSGHKAASLNKELIGKSDLILAMEKIHKDEVIRLAPGARDKTHLLKENYSIQDPIGKPVEVYERVLSIIKEAVQKVAEKI